MRHGLQRQTLMCASVIKCDLVSGIHPLANYGGVSLSLSHCSHQCVGMTLYRLILAFSDTVPQPDCDSRQRHRAKQYRNLQISRWSFASSGGFVSHSFKCKKRKRRRSSQLFKMPKFPQITENMKCIYYLGNLS